MTVTKTQTSNKFRRPIVAVVIPTHNRREKLLECLGRVTSLEAAEILPVVVFDGCTDGSIAAVSERYPQTVIVEGDGNLWWTGAIDAGIRAGRELGAEYFCLLNDDVMPDVQMIRALLQVSDKAPGALVGSMVCFMGEPERIWCAGGYANWRGSGITMRGNGSPVGPNWNDVAEVHWLPGMGTLIPTDVLDRIGGFDRKAFPHYFGDTDFSLRAHRAGIRVLVCPDALLFNDVDSTGILLPKGPIKWRTAHSVLFSMRSHANVRIRMRFWLRHCPLPLVIWQAARFYVPLCAAITKKLSWDRLRSRRLPQS